MTMNPLPPQAYTKETLLKAYHWVQSQAPSIREMAITPDILVSLYLKASRDGNQSLENPSIQNFKSELRSLAGMMGELEGPQTPPPPAPPTPKAQTAPVRPSLETITSAAFVARPLEPLPDMVEMTGPPHAAESRAAESRAAEPSSPAPGLSIDKRSMEILREVKTDFNLSSDTEALRMLIQIGAAKAKHLLKN